MQPWYKVHLFHFTRTKRELKLSCNHWVLNTHNTCSNTKETTASKSSGYRAQRGSQLPTAPRPTQKPQVNSSALPTRLHPKFCPQYRQVLLLNEQSAQQPKKVILNINMYLNLRSFVSCFHVNTEFRGNISRKMSKLWKDFITKYFQSKKKKKVLHNTTNFPKFEPIHTTMSKQSELQHIYCKECGYRYSYFHFPAQKNGSSKEDERKAQISNSKLWTRDHILWCTKNSF